MTSKTKPLTLGESSYHVVRILEQPYGETPVVITANNHGNGHFRSSSFGSILQMTAVLADYLIAIS